MHATVLVHLISLHSFLQLPVTSFLLPVTYSDHHKLRWRPFKASKADKNVYANLTGKLKLLGRYWRRRKNNIKMNVVWVEIVISDWP
jgi:hypothetical protein